MKIYIEARGDRTVGINGIVVEIDYPMLFTVQAKEDFKERLEKFWSEEFDEPAIVTFEGDCSECGEPLEPFDDGYHQCENPNCINNIQGE